MEVLGISMNSPNGRLNISPAGDRIFILSAPVSWNIVTDEGCFSFSAYAGVYTNFRSGSPIVDLFIDRLGTEKTAICYLTHDLCYTPCKALGGNHPLSRKLSDKLLAATLRYSGMSKAKCATVYAAVRAFGRSAYEDDDQFTESNSALFTFTWSDKHK